MHTVLVLGGYGNFGTVICRALARDAGIRLIVAGRDEVKVRRLAAELGLPEGQGVALDVEVTSLAKAFAALEVDTVIHAAGPFQEQDYRVAQACIAAHCHYLDLADARDFVAHISKLDAAARGADVLLVSGASTCPAMTSAAVDAFLPEFARLDEIRQTALAAPGTIGLGSVRSMLAACGKPLTQWERGYWKGGLGGQGLHRDRFPQPVGARWLSHADSPDLALFPQRYPGVKTVTFHAAQGSAFTTFIAWAGSWLVKWQFTDTLSGVAPGLHWLGRWLGSFRLRETAMHIEMRGLDHQGQPLIRHWYLMAGLPDSRLIPCIPVITLARKLARGQLHERGAMPCVGLLTLQEALHGLAGRNIRQIHA